MCIRTGIRDAYQGVQGACPRRAVTHAEGTAERRAVGAGLRLVIILVGWFSHQAANFFLELQDIWLKNCIDGRQDAL